ncbi:MAG: hypothetical protein WC491_06980 [Candidatus Omnitrophota bacterium]
MKSKFGIIALFDALGARSASVDASIKYLNAVKHLQKEIISTLRLTLKGEFKSKSQAKIFRDLKPRFFGDSILMTYYVKDVRKFDKYFIRIAFIIRCLIADAIDKGILFRGAISIGQYMESKDVALGPAIVDAADWYDKMNQAGVMLTPSASTYLKAELVKIHGENYNENRPVDWLILEDIPLNNGNSIRAYVLNWPQSAININCAIDNKPPLMWFYNRMRKIPVSFGSEEKHKNTEEFFKKEVKYNKERLENEIDEERNSRMNKKKK